jgi:hypothetical protein
MGPVLLEIDRQKQAEKAAEFARNEAELLRSLKPGQRAPLDLHEREAIAPYLDWCAKKTVRHCPAKLAAVATFIFEFAHRGADFLIDAVNAIERLHDVHNMPNPCATSIVREALASVFEIDPPRSWPKEDRTKFLLLPIEIQWVVRNREEQRDKDLRRRHNELHKLRQELDEKLKSEETSTGAVTSGEDQTAPAGL